MINRTHPTFGELYGKELQAREFDIVDVSPRLLVAKYVGNHVLRQGDTNVEAHIQRVDGQWTLESLDAFCANRTLLRMQDEPRVLLGMYNGTPRYAPGRRLIVLTLEEGIVQREHRYPFLDCRPGALGQYASVPEHHLNLARDEAQRLTQKFKDNLRIEGFLLGEAEALGLTGLVAQPQ